MQEYVNNGKKLAYQIYGGGEKKLLLLHDIGCSSGSLSSLIDHYKSRVKVLVIDLCGHGQSYLPENRVSLKTMARETVNLLVDCYIGKVDVIAAGVGGYVALLACSIKPELFGKLVFLDSFICKAAWQMFSERIRPQMNSARYQQFRNTFKRWIPAFRDDFFIFCDEFDGRELCNPGAAKMLFIHGDRGNNIKISREMLYLPEYSNIAVSMLAGADRLMLETHFDQLARVIDDFLFEHDGDMENQSGDDIDGNPQFDINNLMYLR